LEPETPKENHGWQKTPIFFMVKTHGFPVKIFPWKPTRWSIGPCPETLHVFIGDWLESPPWHREELGRADWAPIYRFRGNLPGKSHWNRLGSLPQLPEQHFFLMKKKHVSSSFWKWNLSVMSYIFPHLSQSWVGTVAWPRGLRRMAQCRSAASLETLAEAAAWNHHAEFIFWYRSYWSYFYDDIIWYYMILWDIMGLKWDWYYVIIFCCHHWLKDCDLYHSADEYRMIASIHMADLINRHRWLTSSWRIFLGFRSKNWGVFHQRTSSVEKWTGIQTWTCVYFFGLANPHSNGYSIRKYQRI
jgi:hypothetical protein